MESVQFKSAEFVINEYKGRNDLKALKDTKFNILLVSETMTKAREAMKRAKSRATDIVAREQPQQLQAA